MEKLIIENRSDLDMKEVMELVKDVVASGRITTFFVKEKEYGVLSQLNKKSDKLIIENYGKDI